MNLNCIIVVDSDEISHFILKKHFKDIGVNCEIKFFSDVEDGINFIYDYSLRSNDNCPELILVDLNINMAGKDGYDFLEMFRHMKFANKKNIKLAVLSNVYLRENRIKRMKAMLKFKTLLKPATKNQLESLLNIEKEVIVNNIPRN